ncbi:hypothetical protein Sinac_0838 [Singulisphaera acidiphila DSM 18658]|uniref:Uncharacterized protein n=1 Tax=Singulisphaera acidiphila (strain ATCC BAA-1392 / DSM 18658 / VKM B-2454 / MOB10) TaxID=886293 RepID=L0D8Q2_SINAD|nr:hypothetical protein Sinac_0838 [Singulisphaera acidiphila DSM 18658]
MGGITTIAPGKITSLKAGLEARHRENPLL